MNRQREIIVTVTYNELGIIIDEKVEPRKTGQWIQKSRTVKSIMGRNYTERWYECSECNKRPLRNRWTNDDNLSDWCPHCGSPMMKEGEG